MQDITLVEINPKKVKKYNNDVICDQYLSYSFITRVDSVDESRIKDVTDKITSGLYDLKTKYTILYLYNPSCDSESRELIAKYGGLLHNRSESYITILTYFSKQDLEKWTNVHNREDIQCGNSERATVVMKTMSVLQDAFEIKDLPAMVVIKRNDDYSEEHLIIDLKGYKANALKAIFTQVISTISNNCEEDFEVISSKLIGKGEIKKESTFSAFNTYEYIDSLLCDPGFKKMVSKGDLARELLISDKTLYNKRRDSSFTRDECFYLIIKFGRDINELDVLLSKNGHDRIMLSGRDGIIRRCISNECSIEETDKSLKKEGYRVLLHENIERFNKGLF